MLDRYVRYMEAVESGKEICKWVKLAVARQRADLARQGQKGFPYVFDERWANLVLKFLTAFRHVSGQWAGQQLSRPISSASVLRFSLVGGTRTAAAGASAVPTWR